MQGLDAPHQLFSPTNNIHNIKWYMNMTMDTILDMMTHACHDVLGVAY